MVLELRTNARQYWSARYMTTSPIYCHTAELKSRRPPHLTPSTGRMSVPEKWLERACLRQPTVMECLVIRAVPLCNIHARLQTVSKAF
jgi:hypothetical protein